MVVRICRCVKANLESIHTNRILGIDPATRLLSNKVGTCCTYSLRITHLFVRMFRC